MNNAESGIVDIATAHSVNQAVTNLTGALERAGITLFALIDHSGEAAKVGMEMPPTKLLVFGNPKSGTPLMLASPSIALDLPLKILVWQDRANQVWISYNAPDYLKRRHGISDDLLQNIAGIERLAAQSAGG